MYPAPYRLSAEMNTVIVIPNISDHHLTKDWLKSIGISWAKIVIICNKKIKFKIKKYSRSRQIYYLPRLESDNYVKACNRGIQFALGKKANYIGIFNADFTFEGTLIDQLCQPFMKEAMTGAAAATKIPHFNPDLISYRVKWKVQLCEMQDDFESPPGQPEILEADFCELNAVVFPASVFSLIGLLDENYDKTMAAIDFGYRLWLNKYRCIYVQSSKILEMVQEASPDLETWHQQKQHFKKNFSCGVNYLKLGQDISLSWQTADENLYLYLEKYGLLNQNKPDLILAHPNHSVSYLFTVWETTRLPLAWSKRLDSYAHIFVPSKWNAEIFQKAGCKKISTVPFGICPDIFQPYGHAFQFDSKKAFLVVCQDQYRKALDVTLLAWQQIRQKMPEAQLFLFKHGSGKYLTRQPDQTFILNKIRYSKYVEERIVILDPLEKLSSLEIAEIYRGAHVLVNNSRSEGFGFPILEAMACGTLTIVPDYSATAEFIEGRNCIPLKGYEKTADYSDMGFSEVGNWWEPSLSHLKECLMEAYSITESERQLITHKARQFVIANYTWRSSMRLMRETLISIQNHDTGRKLTMQTIKKNRLSKKILDRVYFFRVLTKELGFSIACRRAMNFISRKIKNRITFFVEKNICKRNQKVASASTRKFLQVLASTDYQEYPLRAKWYNAVKPKVSILILNYNTPDITIRCIQEVWRHTEHYNYEIIVIDNGSEEDNFTKLHALGNAWCQIIRLNKNRFFPEGCNIASQFAKGEYLVFLNNDAFVTDSWLNPLMSVAFTNIEAGIVGPKFLYPDGSLQEAGARVDTEGFAYLIGEGKRPDLPQFNEEKEVDYISAACFLIKKSVFESVLGFDVFYGQGYYEDVDLAFKLKLLNKKTIYCPHSSVVHIKNYTSAKNPSIFLNFDKNHLKFIWRWQSFIKDKNNRELETEMALDYAFENKSLKTAPTVGIYFPDNLRIGGNEKCLLTMATCLSKTHNVVIFFDEIYSQLALQTCLHELGLESCTIEIKKLPHPDTCQIDIFIAAGSTMTPTIAPIGIKNVYFLLSPYETSLLDNSPSYLSRYDKIMVRSDSSKSRYDNFCIKNQSLEKPIAVVYIPGLKKADIDINLKKNSEKMRILMVGSFRKNSQKNHFKAIEIFSKLLAKTSRTDFIELHFAGHIEDHLYFNALRSSIQTMPIYFHPNVSAKKLHHLYKSAHFYWQLMNPENEEETVLSGSYDLELSMIEAMSCGCVPFVSQEKPDIEVVDEDINGLHYSSDHFLIDKTLQLIESPALFEKLSSQAIDKSMLFTEEGFMERVRTTVQ